MIPSPERERRKKREERREKREERREKREGFRIEGRVTSTGSPLLEMGIKERTGAARSSQCKNNCLAEMWSGAEEGSYSRLIDGCITEL